MSGRQSIRGASENAGWSRLLTFIVFTTLLASGAHAACSSYQGKVVFNEVYDPSSGTAYVEIRTLDPGVVSATGNFSGWKIDLYKNNVSTRTSVDFSSQFTNIATNTCGQKSAWIRIPDTVLNNYISGSNGISNLNFVLYEAVGNKIVDVLRLGAASSFYGAGTNYSSCPAIESALPGARFDAAWGSNGNKDWYRNADGVGTWGGQSTGDNSHTVCGNNNGGGTFGLSKVPSVTSASTNTSFDFTLYAQNGATGADLGNVQITDDLNAPGLTFVSCTTSAGTCTQAGGVVTWNVGALAKGASVTATLKVRAATAGLKTNTIVANQGSPLASASGAVQVNAPLADWRMDEKLWNGTASEVKDSSGNNHHGTARIAAGSTSVPAASSVSPAYSSGSESTCGYGEFDRTTSPVRTYGYVQLPTFPALPSSFTFSAWIRSTNASAQHQRILVRDDADNGWGLSLADGSEQPELRFFNRNITNTGAVTGQGRNPGCGVFCLDTDPVIASNAWYYIAAAIDTTGKVVTLYVFDAAGSLKAKTSAEFSGVWKDGTGMVNIGGESSASSEGRQSAFHFLGNIDELQIFSGVLSQSEIQSLLTRTRACAGTTPTAPANFNCVESGANAASGHLYTRLAGTGFSFDVVALKADGSVETTYASAANKNVTVELVDGAGATACAARAALSPAVSQTLVFTQANQPTELGRKAAASMTVSKAYADLRCRVTDANQSSRVVGCSTDNFAVRPSGLTVTSSANAAGSNPGATPAIKTGTNFTLSAASGALGYNGMPKLDSSKVAAHAGALQAGTLAGSFGNADIASGSASGTFTYSEVGYFNLASAGVYDDTFAGVDSASGDCTADFSNAAVGGKVGCKFGNVAPTSYFGRFIPDHFAVSAPAFVPGCGAGGFSYMDQPFTLSATIEARNSVGVRTRNYSGAFANGVVSLQMENANGGTPVPGTRLGGLGAPAWAAGGYPFVANQFLKPAGGPDGPFDSLDIGLAVADEAALVASARPYLMVRDMDASNAVCTVDLTGLSTAASVCTATKIVSATRMRFGRLQASNAYGSELLALPVPLVAGYWNGSAFVRNTSDSCTTLAVPTSAAGLTLQLANSGSTTATLNAPLLAGDAGLRLSAPGAGHTGYVDITIAAPSYLQYNWKGAGNVDPSARATFGVYKTPLIYRRENY